MRPAWLPGSGHGTLCTQPNDFEDGYLEADYDGCIWHLRMDEKIAHMAKWLSPYFPWDPGTVTRYRDHDFYVLGAAVDGFLKSVGDRMPMSGTCCVGRCLDP